MEYGLVTERTEGQIYLMRRLEDRPNWCLAVAALKRKPVDDPQNWQTENFTLYSVLWRDVTLMDKGLAEKILKLKGEKLRKK